MLEIYMTRLVLICILTVEIILYFIRIRADIVMEHYQMEQKCQLIAHRMLKGFIKKGINN